MTESNGQAADHPTKRVLVLFKTQADQLRRQASEAARITAQIGKDYAWEDSQHRGEHEQLMKLEAEVSRLRASLGERAERMAALRKQKEDADAQAARLLADADEADRMIRESYARLQAAPAAAGQDGPAARRIGSLEMCPGCRQPVGWDGLGWTHATATGCTADLSGFAPQQDGGAER